MDDKVKKVFVAMSGGVDSSVAAFLLKKEGYEVVGIFMRCYNIDGCAERDAEDARRVAEHLQIPFYAWDFEREYKERVVQYMIDGYKRGITPNPDVMCNREIKFGLFLKKALMMGADYVATGHYVRLEKGKLFEAVDKNKDQSYFLWTLAQSELAHCLFPVGDYLKSEVRRMARLAGLPTAEKKDSQGICFLGEVTLADFLREYLPERRGDVMTTAGKKIGEHNGAHFYTIGQRHVGANYEIKGSKGAEMKPRYVADKNMKTNAIIVAEGKDDPALYRKEMDLCDVNWIFKSKRLPIGIFARVRYRQPLASATLYENKIIFNLPQKFVAPGQSVVFYASSGEMLGGGVIL